MRTAAHRPSLTIDRKTILLFAVVMIIIATVTLIITDISRNTTHTSPVHVQAVSPMHRPTDRGVGVPRPPSLSDAGSRTSSFEANGLPIVPAVAQDQSAVDHAEQMRRYMIESFARRGANQSTASDRAIWTFFPGHEGFIGQ